MKLNDLMREKCKKTCKYVEHVLILASKITGCVSIYLFTSMVAIHVGIASSVVGIKICPCAITKGMKKYESIIKKKKKKPDKIVLLGKIKVRYHWSSNF